VAVIAQRNNKGMEMKRGPVSGRTFVAVLCFLALAFAGTSYAADPTHHFSIPSEDLATALEDFGRQSGDEILFNRDDTRGKSARAVSGDYASGDALSKLLAGSGLTVRQANTHTFVVESGIRPASPPNDQNQSGSPTKPTTSTASGLEEIIVTAQKRSERLEDVPIPVTAINAQTLINTNQLRIQDYNTSVPGFTVAPQASSSFQLLSIRGITTGVGTNPTVGVTVDDVPYGSSTNLGGGSYVPDIDPAELARVEVLRGPQGTLYGASSMGGLFKFVTLDPSTDALTGRVQAGTDTVYNGAELGYNFRASVNVPLNDTMAVRVSAFTREDPGYIDNPVLHISGINEQWVSGGRLSALWKPSEFFSLKISALYQDSRGKGISDVDQPTPGYTLPPLGDLQQSYLPGTGRYDRQLQAYSATATAKVGSADLTFISAYNINSFADSYDLTYAFGPYTQTQFGVSGTPVPERNSTRKFVEEARLATSLGERVDWLLGAFYTHENSQYVQNILAANATTGSVVGQWVYSSNPTTYAELAAFTDFTFHVTSQFDIQLGGRESAIKQTSSAIDIGSAYTTFFLVKPSPVVYPESESKADVFTYLVTPRFHLTSDVMVYARLASGYRAGGPNAALGVPAQFDKYSPDKTESYEMGFKGDFLDRRLSVDTSAYYIDWKDIQILLYDPVTFAAYNANAAHAKSEGLEVSLESKPVTGITLSSWVVWNEAVLTQAFPPGIQGFSAVANAGDRLPYSARWSGNLAAEQDFPLAGSVTGLVGGAVSYIGQREGEFTTTPVRQDLPGYAKFDLRAGVKYEAWSVNFFANNVADKRGLLSGGLGTFPPFAYNYIQPRTIGVSVARTF
jgi:iron complex outermembrane receptor protein